MNTSDTPHHPKRVLGSGYTFAVIIGGIIGLDVVIMVAIPWPVYRSLVRSGSN